jgi:hypothetical protein
MAAAEASHFLWAMTDSNGNPVPSSENNAWQLSEQVLMECCGQRYNTDGCNGGSVSGPMKCAANMGSLPSTTSHPYKASTLNSTCSVNVNQVAAVVTEWYEPCNSGDEVLLPKCFSLLSYSCLCSFVSPFFFVELC